MSDVTIDRTIDRTFGIAALGELLRSAKNVRIFENMVWESGCDSQAQYNDRIFQVACELGKKPMRTILTECRNGKWGWDRDVYDIFRHKLKEHDDFIVSPFEVSEGATECYKCGSKKVFTYQKQTRSCDEPASTFAQCMNCNKCWVYSG